MTKTRREIKKIMVDAMGSCCQVCGYDRCLAALEFHHLDPSKKRFSPSHMLKDGLPWSTIICELRKSILICGNCHKEYHEGLIRLPDTCARFNERYRNIDYKPRTDGSKPTHRRTAPKSKA